MSRICGIKTISSPLFHVKIVASITLASILFTHNCKLCVPLQSLADPSFSSKIIGDSTLCKDNVVAI